MSRQITIDIADLWAIWSKGRATGAYMVERNMILDHMKETRSNDYAQQERDQDICGIIGYDAYTAALKEFGSKIPKYLKDYK